MSASGNSSTQSREQQFYDPLVQIWWPEDKIETFRKCRVLVCGVGGLGLEVAKNLLENGVEQLTLMDSDNVSYEDLADFYSIIGNSKEVMEDSVIGKKNRAERALIVLDKLNPFGKINVKCGKVDSLISDVQLLKEFDFVICTDHSLSSLVDLAQVCHDNHIKFIASDMKGLSSFIFCDLGEHKIKDLNPGFKEGILIKNIINGNPTTVELYPNDEFIKEISVDHYVVFRNISGMTQLNEHKAVRVKSKSNSKIIVELDSTNFGTFQLGDGSAYLKKSNLNSTMSTKFKSLKEELENSTFRLSDPMKVQKRQEIHHAWIQLDLFEREKNKIPRPYHEEDALEFVQFAKERISEQYFNQAVCKTLAYTCQGRSAPFTSITGAFIAMEILKNLSMYYIPIHQLDYLEVWDCLPSPLPSHEDCVNIPPEMKRYQHQIYLIGKTLQSKIMNSNEAIFGMGGLGWECLKNYALMGLSSAEQAPATSIIDAKDISFSNLLTHPFAREEDITKFANIKSMLAVDYVKDHINPQMKVDIIEEYVKTVPLNEDDEIFMWKSMDEYSGYTCTIPGKSISDMIVPRVIGFSKRAIFATTDCLKGTANLMIPHLSQKYEVEDNTPSYPQIINYYASMKEMIKFSINYPFKEMFNELAIHFQPYADLNDKYTEVVQYNPSHFENSIRWSVVKFNEYFDKGITEIMQTYFAPFMMAGGNLPEYLNRMRKPVPVPFDITNAAHLDFVLYSAVLRSKVYSVKLPSMEELKAMLLRVLKEEGLGKKKEVTSELSEQSLNEEIESVLNGIAGFQPVEFDSNNELHLDFIKACSLVRAQCYRIPPIIDRYYIKKVAGLTPSNSISNSITAGYATLQYYKFVQESPLKSEQLSNYSIDCTGKITTESFKTPHITAPVYEIKTGNETISVTEWDLLELNEQRQDMIIKEIIDKVKEKYSCEIYSIDLKDSNASASYSLYERVAQFFFGGNPVNQNMISKLAQFTHAFNYPDDEFVVLKISGKSLLDDSPVTIPSMKYYLPRKNN